MWLACLSGLGVSPHVGGRLHVHVHIDIILTLDNISSHCPFPSASIFRPSTYMDDSGRVESIHVGSLTDHIVIYTTYLYVVYIQSSKYPSLLIQKDPLCLSSWWSTLEAFRCPRPLDSPLGASWHKPTRGVALIGLRIE